MFRPSAFIQIGKKLISKGYELFVTGTRAEENLVVEICKAIGHEARPFAGTLQLDEFINLVKDADLLITNNTGPAHIAAAVQTPVVVFYATSNPQHPPWKVPQNIILFDYKKEYQSKNQILQHTYPRKHITDPTDEAVVAEVVSFIDNPTSTFVPVLWST